LFIGGWLASVYPKVSVLWLNYNSMHVIETTRKSLDALASLDYPDFEVVLVDNGSSDGSWEEIEKHLQTKAMRKLKAKHVKLSKNLGYTGGVDTAYRMRDSQSKYVAVTHNDIVAKPHYLRTLVDYFENHQDVGALQGIVKRLGSDQIDSAGFVLDEALNLCKLLDYRNFSLKKPVFLSYVEGAMPFYRIEAVQKSLKSDKELFVWGGFMYYLEDVFLSVMLWSHSYKCVLLPVVTGEHLRMAVSSEHVKTIQLRHYLLRNHIALLYMTNSADKARFILQTLRRAVLSRGSFATRQMMLKSLIEGLEIGRQLRKKYGVINIYQTPLRKTSVKRRLHP
jgi:GT2 family glycosyltransferase